MVRREGGLRPVSTVRPIRQISGGTEFCEEFLDDVEVGAADVIGEVNEGWSVARYMLAAERGGGERGVLVVDTRQPTCFAPDLAALARRVGRADEPVVRQLVAQGHVLDVVGTALRRRVLALGQAGVVNPASIAAYAKLAEGTFAPERARLGLAIGGAAPCCGRRGVAGRRRRRPSPILNGARPQHRRRDERDDAQRHR